MARARPDLGRWLDRHDGIAAVTDALDAGFTRYAIRLAVERGLAVRVRRRWLARPTAHADLVFAARAGGTIACVSAARRHGVWTVDDGRTHLVVPAHAGHVRADGAIVHWSAGPLPPDGGLVEPLIDALWHLADCRPRIEALAAWESAIRLGRVDLRELSLIPARSEAVRRVRDAASELSDSGIETIPVARLKRIGVPVRQQVRISGHHVDLLIGERLVLQMDGWRFHSARDQRRADIAHDRRLQAIGYTVLRYDYDEIIFGWDLVELEIRAAMARGAHRAA